MSELAEQVSLKDFLGTEGLSLVDPWEFIVRLCLLHLVVIIPCLNESRTISQVIAKIPGDIPGISHVDVVVVDDGSSDDSAAIARNMGAYVVSHPNRMGVGVAFNTGLNQAIQLGADIMVNIDGDGQFDPGDIPKLVQPILEGRADFVTASRFKDANLEPGMPWIKKWGNKGMARLISILTGHKFYDVTCGFRAYSKETMLQLNLIGKFTYTQETFLDLAFKDIKIKEMPIKVLGQRQFGNSRVTRSIWAYAVNSGKIILRAFR
ncbi:MAG TPA: glycosyltransferase family 2 protein, partial [Desulfohalobiaceae bacterium]|nr:glycosyltransferase family 2 protein [Desulfohalobiaceae bacterium]